MFKKTKQPDFIVGHRLGGNHAKRDPLLDEKLGSNKRCRTEDGSASVIYKETAEEKKVRRAAEKQAEKELRKGMKPATPAEGSSQPETASGSIVAKKQESKAKLSALASFKERLRESDLPEAAADAEKKHKESMKEDEAKALAKTSSSSGVAAEKTPDLDERLSMNDIWKASEGDDESDGGDWLQGKGLKFHTTADKAFSMAAKRFKESVECHDPLAGEAAADQAKKRSELRMAEMRRQNKN
eukprot:TRINITY_DN68339_c0_g1_i1.p1 TRINITY_DN68339_c0_g1~~TRINITY_DN68339_c0_g1_i1.p1  ORF type:complete len:242 (+),score=71.62 TRINITY_DN68339_c0_g1_i1:129-854(+)